MRPPAVVPGGKGNMFPPPHHGGGGGVGEKDVSCRAGIGAESSACLLLWIGGGQVSGEFTSKQEAKAAGVLVVDWLFSH